VAISVNRIAVALFVSIGAPSAFGLSPRLFEKSLVTAQFAPGASALPATQREAILREVVRVVGERPCGFAVSVEAYGDHGQFFSETRALALDRLHYIQGLLEQPKLGLSKLSLEVKGEGTHETRYRGMAIVIIETKAGEPTCAGR
jgi:hypothetical protein